MPSPMQIFFAKVVIALIVGIALGTLNLIRRRYGTLWPEATSPRVGVVTSVLTLLLAIPAYIAVSQFGQ